MAHRQSGIRQFREHIVERFEQSFTQDEARVAVLEQLISEGDRRPLYLFLETSRQRPRLMVELCQRAKELPVSVQRNLVAMPEAEPYVPIVIDQEDPGRDLVHVSGVYHSCVDCSRCVIWNIRGT